MVSEGAHPNYVGTVESYQRADTKSGICELIDSPVQRDPERIAIPVDFAAGALLIREAGGAVTAVTGAPLDLAAPTIAASNGPIHSDLLHALKEVAATQ